MKSLFNAALGRLTFGIILSLTVATANAQSDASGPVGGTDQVVVKYLGPQDDMLVFNVTYYNPQGNRFIVAIKDQDGNQLYQDSFKDKSFDRQFLLPRNDKDRIVFVFNNGQDTPVVKTFAVNINSRLVQEVAIKKL